MINTSTQPHGLLYYSADRNPDVLSDIHINAYGGGNNALGVPPHVVNPLVYQLGADSHAENYFDDSAVPSPKSPPWYEETAVFIDDVEPNYWDGVEFAQELRWTCSGDREFSSQCFVANETYDLTYIKTRHYPNDLFVDPGAGNILSNGDYQFSIYYATHGGGGSGRLAYYLLYPVRESLPSWDVRLVRNYGVSPTRKYLSRPKTLEAGPTNIDYPKHIIGDAASLPADAIHRDTLTLYLAFNRIQWTKVEGFDAWEPSFSLEKIDYLIDRSSSFYRNTLYEVSPGLSMKPYLSIGETYWHLGQPSWSAYHGGILVPRLKYEVDFSTKMTGHDIMLIVPASPVDSGSPTISTLIADLPMPVYTFPDESEWANAETRAVWTNADLGKIFLQVTQNNFGIDSASVDHSEDGGLFTYDMDGTNRQRVGPPLTPTNSRRYILGPGCCGDWEL